MNGFRRHLWKSLTNRDFRREYVAENVRTGLAYQIKAIRNARGMSQTDLAKATNKSQGNIARLENPDYGNFSLNTLLELANAFDVWLSVEFIPFSSGVTKTENRSPEVLNAIPFANDWEGRGSSVGSSANSNFVIAVIGKSKVDFSRNAASGFHVGPSDSLGAVGEKRFFATAIDCKAPVSKMTSASQRYIRPLENWAN